MSRVIILLNVLLFIFTRDYDEYLLVHIKSELYNKINMYDRSILVYYNITYYFFNIRGLVVPIGYYSKCRMCTINGVVKRDELIRFERIKNRDVDPRSFKTV